MTNVTPANIKNLRETTGAGMLDCKKALEATSNVEEATDWLRKKGLASAAKKAGRVAAEGLIAVATSGNTGAMIELNSETDFVARNDQFQELAGQIAELALAKNANDVNALKAQTLGGDTVEEAVKKAVGTIGENINLRRTETLSVDSGAIAAYTHNSVKPGMGKIGVLVAINTTGDAAKAAEFGKKIAMHIAAARPEALTTEDLDATKVDRERAVFKDQAIASGKPAEIAEKMVEGRIRKYYEEVVLMQQVYMLDGKTKIADLVKEGEKEVGAPVQITGFKHFLLGDGIEKEEADFAAEVAAAAG